MSAQHPVGNALFGVFLLSLAVAVLALVWWLLAMLLSRDPRLPRRLCLITAGLVLASLAVNALL
ncbi:hypothetical protein ACFQ3L_04120 [Lacticaseibacillus jixianensis]|uniref:Uncharacterized protein n=1 Tax=Lacticaseibacillus jixianensis TaxID=2486012 RepID=A0ABW4B6W4_9LACO|nr:hypothetical protein [Lacticaseibacillus jixianensis]